MAGRQIMATEVILQLHFFRLCAPPPPSAISFLSMDINHAVVLTQINRTRLFIYRITIHGRTLGVLRLYPCIS